MSKFESVLIAPSLLSADPLKFGSEVEDVEAAGADWHHIDVMDGHFVPNLTFGLPLIRAIKKIAKIPLDVHIMVSNPDEVAEQYLDAGADILVFHVEAARHSHRLVQQIRAKGRKAGISLNPGTSVEQILGILPHLDVVMLMSVNPGFGGQSFIPETYEKIKQLKAIISGPDFNNPSIVIEVDGGVTSTNAPKLVAAGAGALVAGTAVYGQKDRRLAIEQLRNRR